MTLAASIENRFTSRRVFNEAFVNLHDFLSSTCAPLGVTRIACSSGSLGLGMSYWDTLSSASNNAWATFRFGSATTPFYVLIQYTESASLGASPGNPGLSDAGASDTYRLAVQVAMREDGGVAWNGTTNNNNTDTKGTPVWTAGGSRLHVFPRSNAPTGSHVSSMQNMHSFMRSTGLFSVSDLFNMSEGGTGAVTHWYADENNLLFLTDPGALGNFAGVFFGKYLPRADIAAAYPYAMLGWFQSSADQSPFKIGSIYGSTGGSITTNTFAGGVIHPSSSYGVRTFSAVLHELFHQSRFHPNRSIITASNRYDEHRPMIVMNEEPNHYGYIGTTSDFFRIGWGMPTGAVSSSGDWAAFNLSFAFSLNRPWNTYHKIIVPWTGSVAPYSLTSRQGLQFTR